MIEGDVYRSKSTGGVYTCKSAYDDHAVMARLVSGYDGNDPERMVVWLGQDGEWDYMSDKALDKEVDRLLSVAEQWEDMGRRVRENARQVAAAKKLDNPGRKG